MQSYRLFSTSINKNDGKCTYRQYLFRHGAEAPVWNCEARLRGLRPDRNYVLHRVQRTPGEIKIKPIQIGAECAAFARRIGVLTLEYEVPARVSTLRKEECTAPNPLLEKKQTKGRTHIRL